MAAQTNYYRPHSSSLCQQSGSVPWKLALASCLGEPHFHLNLHPGKTVLLMSTSPPNGFTSCSRCFDGLARTSFRTERRAPPEIGRVLTAQTSQPPQKIALSWRKLPQLRSLLLPGVSLIFMSESAS